MKATAMVLINLHELQQAEKMAMDRVKPKYDEWDFYFNIHSISYAFLTKDPNMSEGELIKIMVAGKEVILKYDEHVWHKIKFHFTQ